VKDKAVKLDEGRLGPVGMVRSVRTQIRSDESVILTATCEPGYGLVCRQLSLGRNVKIHLIRVKAGQ
jgi:hypothetical protein